MDGYRYPDPGDRVTATFIQQREPYPGYWAASERRALELLGDRLTDKLGPRRDVRALDAGCGEGRLLPWAAQFAADITASDPDTERIGVARERVAELPADTSITFQQSAITGINGGPYKLVLCSHIVQHVATTDIRPAMRHLYEITAPGGVLVLVYSRAPVGHGGFSLEWTEQGELRSSDVDQQRFDEVVTTDACPGVLPVRHLDPEEFGKEVAAAGWTACWDWTYHVLDDLGVLDRHIDRDELINDVPTLRQNLGRDIFTLWLKDR